MEQQPVKKRRLSLEDKLKHGRETHALKPICLGCRLDCSQKIFQRRRISIYLQFWNLPVNDRKTWIHRMVEKHEPNFKRFSSLQRGVRLVI
jgi:hypothetical protein